MSSLKRTGIWTSDVITTIMKMAFGGHRTACWSPWSSWARPELSGDKAETSFEPN